MKLISEKYHTSFMSVFNEACRHQWCFILRKRQNFLGKELTVLFTKIISLSVQTRNITKCRYKPEFNVNVYFTCTVWQVSRKFTCQTRFLLAPLKIVLFISSSQEPWWLAYNGELSAHIMDFQQHCWETWRDIKNKPIHQCCSKTCDKLFNTWSEFHPCHRHSTELVAWQAIL